MDFTSLRSFILLFLELSFCTEGSIKGEDRNGKSESNILWSQGLFSTGRLLLRSDQCKPLFHRLKFSLWGSPPLDEIFERSTHWRMLKSTKLTEELQVCFEQGQGLGLLYSIHLFPANGFNYAHLMSYLTAY